MGGSVQRMGGSGQRMHFEREKRIFMGKEKCIMAGRGDSPLRRRRARGTRLVTRCPGAGTLRPAPPAVEVDVLQDTFDMIYEGELDRDD